jgi:hypothetical protein
VSILLALAEAVSPVSVSQTGVTWGSILISAVSGGGLGAVVVAIVKIKPTLKRLTNEGDASLRADLMAQLKVQDDDHRTRVASLESRLDDQKKSYETKLEFERVVHSNDLATMRHRMNNLDQCLTMLLALIETNPDKAQEAAKRVRLMREKQEAVESAEKALLAAGRAGAVVAPIIATPTAP